MTKTVEFFFDFGSPTAYLAWTQLPKLAADCGARLKYRPMLLGGVFKATGNASPVTVPAKGRWMNSDIPRWARRYCVPFNFNPHFPINTLTLMRGAVGVQMRQPELFERYCQVVYGAMWQLPQNLGDPAVLTEVLGNAGFDVAAFTALVADAEPLKGDQGEGSIYSIDGKAGDTLTLRYTAQGNAPLESPLRVFSLDGQLADEVFTQFDKTTNQWVSLDTLQGSGPYRILVRSSTPYSIGVETGDTLTNARGPIQIGETRATDAKNSKPSVFSYTLDVPDNKLVSVILYAIPATSVIRSPATALTPPISASAPRPGSTAARSATGTRASARRKGGRDRALRGCPRRCRAWRRVKAARRLSRSATARLARQSA